MLELRLGTSGIVLPGAKASFPPEYQAGTRLTYYSDIFNTLEVNSSFYKIPKPQTFAKWATEVPANFRFTVKLWKGITHLKELDFSPEDIGKFVQAINSLGQKKGCLLIQFPASVSIGALLKVESILANLQVARESGWQLAIELRHRSWYQESAWQMFQHYGAAIVLHDMPGSETPFSLSQFSSDCVYLRFHGPTGKYDGSYADDVLQRMAETVLDWQGEGKQVYVYFNNTIGNAFNNAKTLERFLKR